MLGHQFWGKRSEQTGEMIVFFEKIKKGRQLNFTLWLFFTYVYA
jgi:hypothetical protein